MKLRIDSEDYLRYLREAFEKLSAQGKEITAIDAATGDGDHWVNLSLGFKAILDDSPQLIKLPIYQAFRKIGMLMMSKTGGSSGILYGGAYIAASKAVDGCVELDETGVYMALKAMVEDMMQRGGAAPGCKTMIDTLYPACEVFGSGLKSGKQLQAIFEDVKAAAETGAEATRNMPAAKGRASYRKDRAVGFLDAGAVTMAIQLACLCDSLSGKLV